MIDKDKHYALYGQNGKQASLKNQGKIATQIKAVQMQAADEGDGIVSLLLPRNSDEEKIINDAMEKYIVKQVRFRNKGEKAELREAIKDSCYIAQLGVLFHQANANRPSKIAAIVREFSKWIVGELKNTSSQAYKITNQIYPGIIEAEYKPSWWEKQISARKSIK